jgi:hypothetical protein
MDDRAPEQQAAQERYEQQVATMRAIVDKMSEAEVRQALTGLEVERSRLNDRYMAFLHDQQREREHVTDAALAQARNEVARAAHFQTRQLVGSLRPDWLISKVLELPDKPKADDLRALRLAAYALQSHWASFVPPSEHDIAVSALDALRATHHHAVLRWQDRGGRPDSWGSWGIAPPMPGAEAVSGQ